MVDPQYATLTRTLLQHGILCQFQTPHQLVISTQTGPVWPDRGNSFWITHAGGGWHLFTWAPIGYRLIDPTRISHLCQAFIQQTARAGGKVPPSLAADFGLIELSDAEAAAIYQAMDRA